MNRYYSLTVKPEKAVVTIYGDITSYPWDESDVSAYNLSKQLEGVDADVIEVYINSYGGEVAEGLAIYNALKRHSAKVVTYVDGFACSIASVIAMAGEERHMYPTSLMLIHNAWTTAAGNANELRKVADDLEIMTGSVKKAYQEHCNVEDAELQQLLDNESWITAEDALEKGFITKIADEPTSSKQSASARSEIQKLIMNFNQNKTENNANEAFNALSESLEGIISKLDNLASMFNEIVIDEDSEDNEEQESDAENSVSKETMVSRFIEAVNKL